MNFLLWNLCKE